MGRLINFIVILIMIDLLFIITGQTCTQDNACSLSSILFNTVLNIGSITTSQLFTELFGNIADLFTSGTGLTALTVFVSVATGFLISTTDTKAFIPMGISLGLIGQDFVVIGSRLIELNFILGTIIIAPIVIVYILTVIEWVRGIDR